MSNLVHHHIRHVHLRKIAKQIFFHTKISSCLTTTTTAATTITFCTFSSKMTWLKKYRYEFQTITRMIIILLGYICNNFLLNSYLSTIFILLMLLVYFFFYYFTLLLAPLAFNTDLSLESKTRKKNIDDSFSIRLYFSNIKQKKRFLLEIKFNSSSLIGDIYPEGIEEKKDFFNPILNFK